MAPRTTPRLALSHRPAALLLALALAFAPACDAEPKPADAAKAPATIEKVEGRVTVAGKEAKVTSCKAVGQKVGVAVELTLDTGITIVRDDLDGTSIRKADGTTSKPDCDRTQIKSGDGSNLGAASWWVGELGLTCKHEGAEVVLDLKLDCGAVERPSNLVSNRKS
jgi:hypothetical protein